MMAFIGFILVATIITLAVNELKKPIELLNKIKGFEWLTTGMLAISTSILFAFWGIFSYQNGLLLASGMEWNNIWFKYFDLTMTALLISGGSSIIYTFIEALRVAKQDLNE